MSVKLREYVVSVTHVEGCKRRRCGPECARVTGGWEADISFRLPSGEPFRRREKVPVSGKAAAKRWADDRETFLYREQLRAKEEAERIGEPKAPAPTLAEFSSRFIEGHAKANRQKASTIYAKESIIKKHLTPWAGSTPLDKLTDEDVQRLKARLSKRKPKTVNNVLTVLSKMLRVAVKWKVIDRMPLEVDLLKVPPPPFDFYDFDDYGKLVDAAGKHDPRTLAAVLLAGDAGLRDGEILGLELTDVDWKRRILTVQRQVWRGKADSPKGGRLRHIPMTAKLTKALQAVRHVGGSPRVLFQDDGSELTYKVLRGWLKSAQTLGGLKATGNCHILRHSFCSHLAMKGASVKAIQELAGHQHIATTMRYMHLSPGAKEQAIRLLDNRPTGEAVGDILETGSR